MVHTTSAIGLVEIHNYWMGVTSIDWNTATNWTDGTVPSTSCPDVYIPGGATYQPTLGSGTATIINIHIYSGATLTVDNAVMQIGGLIDNTGTFHSIKRNHRIQWHQPGCRRKYV